MGQQFGLAFDEIGTSQRRNTEVRLTHRWSNRDLNSRSLPQEGWPFGGGPQRRSTSAKRIDAAIVGLELGNGDFSGNLSAANVYLNNIQGPAIYIGHRDVGYHSRRTVITKAMAAYDRTPLYIQSAPGVMTNIGLGSLGQFSIESLQTDLPTGTGPFQAGAFIAGPGSADTLTGITLK